MEEITFGSSLMGFNREQVLRYIDKLAAQKLEEDARHERDTQQARDEQNRLNDEKDRLKRENDDLRAQLEQLHSQSEAQKSRKCSPAGKTDPHGLRGIGF